MSTVIDEKVVEMRFDNKQFEAGVQTSLGTLERLKKGLDLDGAAKSFDSLSDAAGKFNMSALGHAAEAVSTKFSALETIAVGALLKIGSQAVTTGEQLLKSLTVDQIVAGWEKYSDKTTAVQTIMAATGKSIDEVNGSLEKLIWFTDETSYSMTDMTSNIGKFTSQGVDLDTAVTAMEGISTWASLSGGSINEASRAMYNLSQALGVGAVKLQDWKSIENANMATKEFKEMAIEAAVATGDLTKSFDASGNAIYETSKGTAVTAANFSSTLADAWFSSDALLSVLNNYGQYADGVYELYNNLGEGVEKTTSEIIGDLKRLRGAEDQTILDAGYTEDQIDLVRRLSEEVGGIGQKSFAAAQEAKTFKEVIDSVKEAVASGWSQTFESIFGNYEEAKVFWTDLSNNLWDVFASGGEARNELLHEALSVSGFDKFKSVLTDTGIELGSFQEKLSEISDSKGIKLSTIIAEYGSLEAAIQNGAISYDLIAEAASKFDNEIEANGYNLKQFTNSITFSLAEIDKLSGRQHLVAAFWNTWEGVGTLLSTFKDAFREIFPEKTSEQVYNFAKGLNELTGRFKEFLTESEKGQKLLTDIKNTFKGVFAVIDIVKQAISAFFRAISPAGSAVGDLLSGILGVTGSFGEWLSKLDQSIKESDTFYKAIKKVVDFIRGAINAVKNFGSAIADMLNLPSLSDAKENIKEFFSTINEKVGAPGLEFLHDLFENLCSRAKQVRDAIVEMKDRIVDSMDQADRAVSGNKIVQAMTNIWNLVKTIAGAIGDLIGKAFNSITTALGNADFNGIIDFLNALATGGLIAAIKKFLDPMSELGDTISNFRDFVSQLGSGITKILDGVRGSLEAWQTKLKAESLVKIASAIGILAVGLLVLASIDSDKMTDSITAITTLFVELSVALAVLDKMNIKGKNLNKTATGMMKIGAALLILSLAMKNIGELNPNQLAEGLIGVGVLLAEMAAFLNLAKFDRRATKTATGMVIFAAAIKILASAVKDMSSLSWGELAKGLVAVGVLLAEIDIFLNTAKFSGKSMLTATGIVILAAAIKVLASAAKAFGEMSIGEIAKGLGSIALLLAEIAAFTRVSGDAKHVVATGLALIEIAAAMKIFASAMQSFATMSWGEIAKGLVAMGGALAEVALATKIMPKNMVGIGLGLIAVGAALKIVASVLSDMGEMSWEQIAKGLVTLGGAMAELSIGLNLMNGTLKGSAALLVAANAILVLTPALKLLGNMSWEQIAKGLVTIAGAFTILGIAGAVLSPLTGAILALSAALAIIGVGSVAIGAGLVLIGAGLTSISVGITSLATALSAGSAAVVAGLSAIILGIAGLIPAIATKIGEAIVAFCTAIANSADAIADAVKTVVLALVDMLVTCVPTIADGALQLVAGVLSALVAYTPQIVDSIMQFLVEVLEGVARNIPQLIKATMDIVGSFFSGVLSALGEIDLDTFIKGLGAIGLLTGIVAALGAVAAMVPAAMTGVLGVGAVIAELAIVLAAIGGLAQIPGLEWLISEGGGLLQTIGTAIGGFVGGIVGGFASGVSSSFPQIGSDLSAFMTNVQSFINGASNITPDLLSGVENLTGAILLITTANLRESITSWLTGGSSLTDFGNELVLFGESMVAFSNTISGLDADLVDKAATAGKTLAEMAATLPNSGGVLGFFVGNNDMNVFGEQLVVFGEAMVDFGNVVTGLKADAVQNAAIAGKAMAEMASTLPNTGGAVAFFTGDNDMATFAEQLVPFGKAIKEYSDAVDGLKVDAVTNSATAGAALVELANTIPNTGGAVAFFTGDNDLATFGEHIVIFGKSMKEYSDAVDGLKADAVANSATAGAALVELANTIPNTGGLVSFFTGDNDLARFGEQIIVFGEAMKTYSDTLDGFNPEAVVASATAGQALSELSKTLPNTGGLVELFTGGNDLGEFAKGLIPFGEGMKGYGEAVSGLEKNSSAIEASIVAGKSLIELSKTLPNVGGVIDFFTGNNDLGAFANGIKDFGIAMKDYGEAVSGLESYSGSIDASVIAGGSLIELSKTLPNVSGVVSFFTGNNNLSSFSSGIVSFGSAMKNYGEAVSGLEEYSGSIDASVIAGGSLIELSKTLPNTEGVMGFFSGVTDFATFGTEIVAFGKAMKEYADVVSGLESQAGAIEASVIAGGSLIELSKTLPNTGGVMSFFNGTYDLVSFGNQIVDFGKSMSAYSDTVSDIKSESIVASATAGQSLVELANTLPKCGGLISIFTGNNDLAKFGDNIVSFGEDLAAYAKAIGNVKPQTISASANAAKALSDLATGLPDSSVFDKWFGGDQTLVSFGKDISEFGAYMGDYYSNISNVNVDTLSRVVDGIWEIVDLTKGIKNIDTGTMTGFGKALKTMADNSINDFVKAFTNSNNKVTTAVNGMLNTVSNSISSNKSLATKGMQDVMASLSEVVTQKASEINASVSNIMAGVSNAILSSMNQARSAMQSVMGAAVGVISNCYGQFFSAGSYCGQGLIDGIRSKISSASSAGWSLGRASLEAAMRAVDSRSPSKEFIRLGGYMGEGLVIGINNSIGSTSDAGWSLGRAPLDSAKKALDSHSPSKEFIYLGEHIGEGLAIGINNAIVPAEQASSKMAGEVVDAAEKGLNSWEDWLDKRKRNNEISLKDELAGWEHLQQKYAEDSEERIKIDREVYRVQNELVEATYQYSINWIKKEKEYNRLSLEEELAAYERMQSRYIEGSKERMEIDKQVYSLRNQLSGSSYENSMNWIENEKKNNRLSLVDELAAYKRVQSRYAAGTEERENMDREVYRVEKEIYEAQKQYSADVQRVQEEANQKRIALEEEYADKVTSINERLASDIKNLNDQYESALNSRTNSLYQSYGLFDEVKEREEVSGATLLDNLQGQVEEFNEWQRTLDSLSARGLDEELIKELSEMGPSAIAQVKALEAMSDSELNRYVGLWRTKHAQARQQAVNELEGLRIETQNNIVQLRIDAERELEDYRATWQEKMHQIDIDANAELERLRRDFEEKLGLIKKDTETETQEMVDVTQKILEEAGWDETGKQIVIGLKQGVEDEKPSFINALTQMASEGATAVRDELGISSPSRVFRALGNFTGLGFVKGITDYAHKSYEAGSYIADETKSGLSDAMSTISNYLNGDMEMQPTIRPVMDLSDVANGVGMIDSMFYSRQMLALAGQTSFGFSANAGNTEMNITVNNDGVVQELHALRGEMAEMTERIAKMQFILDTGTLIGEMVDGMDNALGQRQSFRGRGI